MLTIRWIQNGSSMWSFNALLNLFGFTVVGRSDSISLSPSAEAFSEHWLLLALNCVSISADEV